jgi:hypothetical protein
VEKRSTDVVGEAQHYLGRSVPPRRYIFCHKALIPCSFRSAAAGRVSPRETKIADFEFAICIEEKISGFHVPMQDIGGVDVLQAAECLVYE